MSYPDSVELDDDGYPTEEWLERLGTCHDLENAGEWLTHTFPKIVAAIGKGHAGVFAGKDDFGALIHVIQYSTGGWSGQEEMIAQLKKTPAWMFHAWSWRRGGHYELRVPRAK